MKIVKYYNDHTKSMDKKCVLTKGEQYDLIQRNQAELQSQATDEELRALYQQTVSFADLTYD